ncbi:hypothetical protein [Pontibacter cellulosilyticus]|uniref:DoxX family membrane protein n=1 Tax=Pontibacter cellulosilyticus TaxID=1720253 RepID=A0A923N8L3_9BACT|nr:hypothetical protein [Pontibacter cellulosilyticus]MBC5993391.1 hypothetical protein [Pontibacter cellulosilyticus]
MKTKITITIARVLLGAIFAFAGINGFLLLIGIEPLGATSVHVPFMQVLVSTPYVIIPLKAAELTAGILLLINRFVPMALLILVPIGCNIFLFHLFADQSLLLNGFIVLGLLSILLYHYRGHYSQLLVYRTDNVLR